MTQARENFKIAYRMARIARADIRNNEGGNPFVMLEGARALLGISRAQLRSMNPRRRTPMRLAARAAAKRVEVAEQIRNLRADHVRHAF